MTPEQLHTLFALAKQHWMDAQATIYAYEREFHRVDKRSRALKLATVVFAGITALSAAMTELRWLTLGVAISTAILAAVEQQYAPAAAAQKFWECRTALEDLKRDIVGYAVLLAEASSFQGGAEPLTQAGIRIGQAARVPVQLEDQDRHRADDAFGRSVIFVLLSRVEAEVRGELITEAPGIPSDVPDIIAVVRGTAA